MVTIIDYGVGNINAFVNVYKRLNITTKIAKKSEDLEDAKKLILPGVGSFDFAMEALNKSGMRQKLEELVLLKKIPILGVCVGMQIMANTSEEGNLEGLKWLDANILKFDVKNIKFATKLPHMGWNDVVTFNKNLLFNNSDDNALFYFLHSYYFKSNNPEDSIAISNYGDNFTVAVKNNNIFGVQFHPEKSHQQGENVLSNFAKL